MGSKYNGSSRLLKIGHEAFEMLEERKSSGKPTGASSRQKQPAHAVPRPAAPVHVVCPEIACLYPYQPQKPVAFQMIVRSSSEEKISIYDSTKLNDGMLINMDYSKRKSTALAY